MKQLSIFIVIIGIFVLVGIGAAQVEHQLFMPMVFCENCPPPPTVTPTPTATNTPKPPTPTPTVTPTAILAEGGNSCVYALGAGRNSDGSTSMAGLVPSVCSYLVPYQVQMDGQLLIVKAERVKTDTWGCEQDDFGPLVQWPPIDYPCPPPPEDELFDEYGRILWGDLDIIRLENSYKIICGYCEECGEPFTTNCIEVYIPKD